MYGYDPGLSNSASTLSECTEGNKSIVILALPSNSEIFQLSGNSFSSCFSCINTVIDYYSEMLLLKCNYFFKKLSVNESFK